MRSEEANERSDAREHRGENARLKDVSARKRLSERAKRRSEREERSEEENRGENARLP